MQLPECEMEQSEYLGRMEAFARTLTVPLVSAAFAHEGGIAMAYFSKEDTIFQKCCFPQAGLQAGEDVTVFDTPLGRLALCSGDDVFQPQYARLAALRGCRLLLCSLWRDEPGYRMTGAWSVCQANCLPVAVAGQAGGELILPCTMTQDLSGRGRGSFDTRELEAAYAEFPVFRSLNREFYSRYRKELGG